MLATGVNPARAMAMEMGRMATLVQYTGGNIGGFVKQLGTMLGLITICQRRCAGRSSRSSSSSVQGRSRQLRIGPQPHCWLEKLKLHLLKSQVASTEGTELEAVAQGKLVKALRAAVAANASAVANEAAAVANVTAGEAAAASAAATTVSISGMGLALIALLQWQLCLGGYLIYRIMTAKDAVEKLVDKLQEHYEKTLQQAEADKIWANSLQGVAEAMDKMADKH
jgi:hypothetical protein